MLECGHPDDCRNDEECEWCEEVAHLNASCAAMVQRNGRLIELEKRRAIRFGPGTHSLEGDMPIGLLLIEKGAVVTLDTDGSNLEWVDVNGGTFNAGRSPTKTTIVGICEGIKRQ